MKTLSLLIPGVFLLCSFTGRNNNTLNDENFKGKVKSVTEYVTATVKGKEVVLGKRVYTYDNNGNEVLIRDYDPQHDSTNLPETRWGYKYNEDGNKVEEVLYNNDGSISWKTLFTYDKSGMLSEANRYHRDGALEERYVYINDANGNKTAEASFNFKGEPNCKSKFKYDHGILVEKEVDCSSIGWMGNVPVKVNYKFDNNNNVIEYLEYYHDDKAVLSKKMTYTDFDQVGNWIKKTEISRRDKIDEVTVTKREISYY
jgi:hypothetical protein